MIFGPRDPAPITKAHFFSLIGESLADGRREPTRLQNTQYNYKGIGAGYPTVRSGQDQYVANPSGVYIYYISAISTDDFSATTGSWQPYVAGGNSSYDDNSFGTELTCAVRLYEQTGIPVYIVKCAFGGTRLTNSTPSASQFPPGNWNPTCRYVASEFYLKRAMLAFRAANPTVRPEYLGTNWYQGVNDAVDGVSAATYQAELLSLIAYWDRIIEGNFVLDANVKPIWNLPSVYFTPGTNETNINTAINNVIATNTTKFKGIDTSGYPRGIDLTAPMAAPLTIGNPNADGGLDNNHTSYIGMLGVGEYMADNIIAHHGL